MVLFYPDQFFHNIQKLWASWTVTVLFFVVTSDPTIDETTSSFERIDHEDSVLFELAKYAYLS